MGCRLADGQPDCLLPHPAVPLLRRPILGHELALGKGSSPGPAPTSPPLSSWPLPTLPPSYLTSTFHPSQVWLLAEGLSQKLWLKAKGYKKPRKPTEASGTALV